MEPDSASGDATAPRFPWDLLPRHLQESILALLPVFSLLRFRSLSRAALSTLSSPSFLAVLSSRLRLRRHPEDLFLLLFLDPSLPTLAAAYFPSSDRWLLLPLPLPVPLSCCPASSSSTLTILQTRDHSSATGSSISVSDLFSGEPPFRLPPIPISAASPYVLALLAEGDDFKVVAVATADRVYCQVYDSRASRWAPGGEFPGQFAVLGSAAPLDGLLFVLSCGPDQLLTFDPVACVWSLVDVEMPAIVFSHVLGFDRSLFLVGGLEEFGVVVRVGIWEFDRAEKDWRLACFMPDDIFGAFSGAKVLSHFDTVDQMGNICFFNRRDSRVLMCDLAARRWWWPPPCHVIRRDRRRWFGQALELSVNLLKPRRQIP